MKFKLFASVCVAAGLAFGLAGCGDDNAPKSGDAKTLMVGASPVPHADILNLIAPQLQKEGITLKVIEFSDYIQPNLSLNDKELDANFFQHKPYLDSFSKDRGLKLTSLVAVHIEPMGVYSHKVKNVADVAEGSEVAIPNDPTNGGRALKVLETAGLIKVRPEAGVTATINDVVDNPKKIKFREIEAAQLPRALDDDRSALAADVGVGGFGIREGFVVGRRNIVTLHEGLGEVLGAFELRGGLRRAEDAQAGGAELVDDAGGERGFGTHDREGDVVALDEFDQLVDVGDRKVFKTGRQGRAGIAGSHENFGHAIALSEAPGESVFTTAVANNEKVHFDGLLETDRRGAPELWERAPRKVKFCRAPSMPELPVGTPYCTARGVRLSP